MVFPFASFPTTFPAEEFTVVLTVVVVLVTVVLADALAVAAFTFAALKVESACVAEALAVAAFALAVASCACALDNVVPVADWVGTLNCAKQLLPANKIKDTRDPVNSFFIVWIFFRPQKYNNFAKAKIFDNIYKKIQFRKYQ
jgi:hypothetical protein